MLKALTVITAAAISTGCASSPGTPINSRHVVVPLENSEFVTNVTHDDKNKAGEIALSAAYSQCEEMESRPVIIDRIITRDGLLGETSSEVFGVVKNVGMVFGGFLLPDVGRGEYTAAYTFRCDPLPL